MTPCTLGGYERLLSGVALQERSLLIGWSVRGIAPDSSHLCITYKPPVVNSMADNPDVAKKKVQPRDALARGLAAAMARSEDLKTQAALARRSGVGQTTIGRILRGEVNPASENVKRLADALGVSLATLFEEDASRQTETPTLSGQGVTIAPGVQLRRVPLISWAQVGSWAEAVRTSLAKDTQGMECPRACGPRTFALRVDGESMEPKYQHGDIIYVDPDAPVAHGKDVIVMLPGRNEVMFRALLIEGDQRFVKSLNPNWPGPKIFPLGADARIIGVVIGKWVDVG